MANGDENAYRAFHAAYFDRLLRYLLVVAAGDEHAAREALQSTLLRVVRHIRAFDDEAVFWSWLTVLARSALADQRRGRRRYLAFLDRFTRHAASSSEPAAAEPLVPLDALLAEQLHRLDAEEHSLLDWKYRENLPVRVIATRLGVSEKAVESRLARLRGKLKDAILGRLSAPATPPSR